MSQHEEILLFSVIPKDGASALLEIQRALATYLQLPSLPEFAATAAGLPGAAVFQLQANVSFLQSQIELARAVVQAKDAAIQSLKFHCLSTTAASCRSECTEC